MSKWIAMSSRAVAVVGIACCAAAASQGRAPDGPRFQVVSTGEVGEVKRTALMRGGLEEWRPADPPNTRGLVVSIDVTFPPSLPTDLDSPALALSYTIGGTVRRAACLGVTIEGSLDKGGVWFLADLQKGFFLHLSSTESTLHTSVLFELPQSVSQASLVYRNAVVVEQVRVPWKDPATFLLTQLGEGGAEPAHAPDGRGAGASRPRVMRHRCAGLSER